MANPRFFLRWHVTLVATGRRVLSYIVALDRARAAEAVRGYSTCSATYIHRLHNICTRACRDPTAIPSPASSTALPIQIFVRAHTTRASSRVCEKRRTFIANSKIRARAARFYLFHRDR
uniref:Secreted protein n=1 Tax=Trichogramma kaykai TaxID=54128 RepID=A0ABD2WUK2_9HYME